MKISRAWLQTYFENPLPDAAALADALTFHAFEIESISTYDFVNGGKDSLLDVKVTPNRGHDCLSHRGIAKELSATLNVPMKSDPLRLPSKVTTSDVVTVVIQNPELCARYIAGYIRGVKVGPSPEWLRTSLEAIGQRSINNVVDATNYVMFDLGQPLHAFDAGRLVQKNRRYSIVVRKARAGEEMLALDEKEYALADTMLVIADQSADVSIGIAGVKGGMPAGITEATTDIIIESANFDGVSVRKTAQALKLRTDASARFEQVISPELAAYGMRAVAALIAQLAGGEVVGFADEYPKPQEKRTISVSLKKINAVLGTKLAMQDIADVFARLNLVNREAGGMFTVDVPFERLDLAIPEDLVEEVGRMIGYDKAPATELPAFPGKPEINKDFYAEEHARENLISKGYSEVYTSVFADKGERIVANKVDGTRHFLRATLIDGLREALEKNTRNKDLLGLKEVKLFEIGTIWRGGKEITTVGIADAQGVRERELTTSDVVTSEYDDLPLSSTERYETFSKYPFIVRDIALWVAAEANADDVLQIIRAHAGDLLVRSEKFDEFKRDDKISFAFRLVFQSSGKTLTDAETNAVMEKIYAAVKQKGWEVR
jgi:phenylalanyl-tRNA synthetase beta chain